MRVMPTPDEIVELTSSWTGERFPNGRPRVPDDVVERLRNATTEQAWSVLRGEGYPRQFAGGWRQTHPDTILVGRAVTSQFVPHRPDLDAAVVAAGEREGHHEPTKQNSWIISTLEPGDVMVTDIFGKIVDGTVIGDNLGTAIATRTHAGAVIDGGIRDYQGVRELDIEHVNFFYRDCDPTAIKDVTLAGINIPVRIDRATVLPGDIVLGTPTGVSFIPAHLAEKVAEVADDIRVRDIFGKLRLSQGKYSSAAIDGTWSDEIEADFGEWKRTEYKES